MNKEVRLESQKAYEDWQIIRGRSTETQEQLANELKAEGFNVTSYSSRDIKNFRLIKVLRDDERYCYAEPSKGSFVSEKLFRMFKNLLQA